MSLVKAEAPERPDYHPQGQVPSGRVRKPGRCRGRARGSSEQRSSVGRKASRTRRKVGSGPLCHGWCPGKPGRSRSPDYPGHRRVRDQFANGGTGRLACVESALQNAEIGRWRR
jgi:hypothetical protein